MGYVRKAHGIRGRVLVAPYNADSAALSAVRKIHLGGRE